MSKHLVNQRFIFKIHSSRLRRAGWSLNMTIAEGRKGKEVIALSESQAMRFIDEINGYENVEDEINRLKKRIKNMKKSKDALVKSKIRELYAKLDELQFKKDYVCIIIDSKKDYEVMYRKGFKINGITYERLLGTTGGVKKNIIVFVNRDIIDELRRRIDNGRDMSKAFTPAKLEAYKALVCSSSTPVSMPNGIVVVPDCVTRFYADVIELNDEGVDEPTMTTVKDKEIVLDNSDGYGLAMPGLMERWGKDIGEDYLLPACVIRNAFCKGAVFPFDFQEFARDNNVQYVTDVWGDEHNIFDVELVLTESMLKLWDSYTSLGDYLSNCERNNYTFCITKASEERLENCRNMNYQFLQSYDFTDEDIDELIAPTVQEIQDVLDKDYRKTLVYMKGMMLNERTAKILDNTPQTALMIEPELMNDPYIRNQIWLMIQKRINDAKVGVLKVQGNYSFASGDPYSLCQSMFGLEVTGLLKAGQCYSKYWIDKGVDKICSFRAPMTSHNNIRPLTVYHDEMTDKYYRYMTTNTIFNSWDTCADAMNGMDYDGDCVINTCEDVIVRNTTPLPAIMCVQRKAPKIVPTEDDMMVSNILSFGNAVGGVTNKVTSMFEVAARFPLDSAEYDVLQYRIKCGQLYQQNQINLSYSQVIEG